MDGQAAIELERPRSVWELIGTTVNLYFRVPILFLVLAAVVVVPYELALLLVTGAGPLALGRTGFVTNTWSRWPTTFSSPHWSRLSTSTPSARSAKAGDPA